MTYFHFFFLLFTRIKLQAKNGTEKLQFSKNETDIKLKVNEEKLYETENELRIVRTLHRARDTEWEECREERNAREIDLREREIKVQDEVAILSKLHKSMSDELAGSVRGESLALSLLKQREALADREKRNYEGLVKTLKQDLNYAQQQLHRERERTKHSAEIVRTDRDTPHTQRHSRSPECDPKSHLQNPESHPGSNPGSPRINGRTNNSLNPFRDFYSTPFTDRKTDPKIIPYDTRNELDPPSPAGVESPRGHGALISPLTRHTTFSRPQNSMKSTPQLYSRMEY